MTQSGLWKKNYNKKEKKKATKHKTNENVVCMLQPFENDNENKDSKLEKYKLYHDIKTNQLHTVLPTYNEALLGFHNPSIPIVLPKYVHL